MNNNIKKRLFLFSSAVVLSLSAMGQDNISVTGKVVDTHGAAVAGASVMVAGTTEAVVTDAEGNYTIEVPSDKGLTVSYVGYKSQAVPVVSGQSVYDVTLEEEDPAKFVVQDITIGAYKDIARKESTSAVSVLGKELIDKRSARNIAHSLVGLGYGLISLDGSYMNYYNSNPTLYVRGLQTLNSDAGYDPLFIVDGIEREISTIVPSDVEEVQILKDAAAVGLFGYKGANNVVYIKTKRGKYEGGYGINVSFDNSFNFQIDRPEFVDAATYARAMNEGLANEGSDAQYSDQDIAAYESGAYPYLFPNVDWVDETFRKTSYTRRYNVEFYGGGKRFRYFTSLSLLANDGFIKHDDENDGYSTQDMYSRGNVRNNLDIKLTDYTDLQINIAGVLSEVQMPGSQANIWSLVYSIPSLAFPVKNENGDWGGTSVWLGTSNPVGQSSGAGYYKIHERALYTDVVLDQSLEMFVEGLKVHGRLSYDNYSTLYEDHSKTYVYGKYITSGWDSDGSPILDTSSYTDGYYTDGESTELGDGANTNSWERRANILAGVSFDRQLTDNQHLFAQVRWDYDFSDSTGTNTTLHRQNITWYSHYGLFGKYFVDVTLDASGSNRLAPDHKWAFSPTVSAAWVISDEDFMQARAINFLKLRASYGKITTDWLPESTWTYYKQSYSRDSAYYPFGSDYSYGETATRATLGRMATEDPTTEKAYKFNVGIDARLFNSVDLQLEYFYQNNKDAWVEGDGAYSAVIGFDAPYVNDGETKSYGFEAGLEFNKKFGIVDVNVGGSFLFNRNEIVEMAEEPRAYDNLVQTGNPLASSYGLIALGLFQTQEEIDNAPTQNFTTTVRPGDIRYKDVNEDGVVDENDVCKISDYSTTSPEIYYTFHLGAEVKGFGINASFQGTGHYSAYLSTAGYYWGLYGNTNLSQEVYDNHWTTENPNAKYPRLSATTNSNNYRASTYWMKDRSYLKLRNAEVYYDFKSLLEDKKVMHGARVFVRGVDLFTIDDIDNMDAASYGATAPLNRSVVLGLSLTF